MGNEEDDRRRVVLKAVFPLLSGRDLAASMCVCRQWRDVGSDDFLWRRLCQGRWPSTCREDKGGPLPIGAIRGYRKLFATFAARKKKHSRPLIPQLSFHDLEFYVDIWVGGRPVYSAVVPGPLVQSRIGNPPAGICESMQNHLQGKEYKMTVPVSPAFEVSFSEDTCMSMLVRRKDNDKIATIIDGSRFDYVDGPECRAHAYDYLQISALYPFLSEIRAWVALLLVESNQGKTREVFGIELDFLDTANTDDEVLCLLQILDWK